MRSKSVGTSRASLSMQDGGSRVVTISPSEMERLIRRAQGGDSTAVTRLYELHADIIYRYIAYRVPDEEVEDLTADVFVKMVEGLPGYRITGAPFEAWLYRIAAARIADHYRRTNQRPQVELPERMTDRDPLPEEQLMHEQELSTLREALQQLSEDQQTVMILRFIERRSHEEVAQIMDKTTSNVKTIQHRALVQLSRLLGEGKKPRHYLRGRRDSD
jgi:RNA polymerase sigma-70 factor, ECF subfamily